MTGSQRSHRETTWEFTNKFTTHVDVAVDISNISNNPNDMHKANTYLAQDSKHSLNLNF